MCETSSSLGETPGNETPARESGEAFSSTPSFEEELQKLQAAVSELERADLTLEEAFGQLEIGFASYRSCRQILDDARERVEVLTREFPGQAPSWEAFTRPLVNDGTRPSASAD